MKRKTLVSAVLCSALLLQASFAYAAETGGGPGGHGGHGGPGGGMGGFQTENDPEIQEVIDGASSKFSQFTYTDSDTGEELEYSLYIPEDYDESMDYPMIMFIPDATGSGKSAAEIVEQYYGAAVWASDEDQEKHKAGHSGRGTGFHGKDRCCPRRRI